MQILIALKEMDLRLLLCPRADGFLMEQYQLDQVRVQLVIFILYFLMEQQNMAAEQHLKQLMVETGIKYHAMLSLIPIPA